MPWKESMILSLLRESTSDLHASLDSGPLFTKLFSHSPFFYPLILHRWLGVWYRWERYLLQDPAIKAREPLVASRMRTPLLLSDVRDLRKMGLVAPPLAAHEKELVKGCVPHYSSSLGTSLGILYVLEGSKLGGKFIAKQLHEIDNTLPLAFFTNGGTVDGGASWKSFTTMLSSLELGEAEQHDLVCSSQHCFSSLISLHTLMESMYLEYDLS
jgi:heme oxygenase